MKKTKMFSGVIAAIAIAALALSSVADAQMIRRTTVILDDGAGIMTPITGTLGGGITIGGTLTSKAHTILDANGNKTVLQAASRAAASPDLTLTLPSTNIAGALMNDGLGNLTWTSIPGLTTTPSFTNLTLTGASNQFILQPGGTGNTLTFTGTNPASSHTIDWGDPGADASIVYTHNLGTQDIVGKKKFRNIANYDSLITVDGTGTFTALDASQTSQFTFDGADAAFTVAKITGGFDGKHLRLYNKTGKDMTLKNGAGTDSLFTYANGDIKLIQNGAVDLVHDGTRWTVGGYSANNVEGTVGSTKFAVQSSDEATTSTSLTDSVLGISISGGQVWEVQGTLIIDGAAAPAPDLTWTITCPGSITASYIGYTASGGASSLQGANVFTASGTSADVKVSGSRTVVDFRGLVQATSNGTIQVKFATTIAGRTITLKANSYMRAMRVR